MTILQSVRTSCVIICFVCLHLVIPCGVRRTPPPKNLLRDCFGEEVREREPIPQTNFNQPNIKISDLNCNFDGGCKCWSSIGAPGQGTWSTAAGDLNEQKVEKCFTTRNLPNQRFAYIEASETLPISSAEIASCEVKNVQQLDMIADTWAKDAVLQVCAEDSCQPLSSGKSTTQLIPFSDNPKESVLVRIVAKNFQQKGGIAAIDDLQFTGSQMKPPVICQCTGSTDDCPCYEFTKNWKKTEQRTGNFASGIPPKPGDPYWGTELKPGESQSVRLRPHDGSRLQGRFKMETWIVTDSVFAKVCPSDVVTDQCIDLTGSDEVTVEDYKWKPLEAPVDNYEEAYFICENRGINVGYCGVDNFDNTFR